MDKAEDLPFVEGPSYRSWRAILHLTRPLALSCYLMEYGTVIRTVHVLPLLTACTLSIDLLSTKDCCSKRCSDLLRTPYTCIGFPFFRAPSGVHAMNPLPCHASPPCTRALSRCQPGISTLKALDGGLTVCCYDTPTLNLTRTSAAHSN